jgi:amino acid permease
MANIKVRPLTIVLVAVAGVLVVVGVIYVTSTAANLPAFFPGHLAHSAHYHRKHGLAAFVLAAVVLIAAWFTTRPEASAAT